MKHTTREKIVKVFLFLAAFTAVLSVVFIAFFVFLEGLPIFMRYGVSEILFGQQWSPTNQIFGILPMVIGTIFVTFLAIFIGAPLGISVAIFLAEISPPRISGLVRPAVELLAGIPSVVYGLFGMVLIVSIIANISRGPLGEFLPPNYQVGFSVLAGGIILAIMILPTVINISEDAIRSVPKEYKEGALALGASKWQTIYNVILPAAKSGIITSVILGTGRALGETMAVIMIVGNTVLIPEFGWQGLFAPVRTLTGNIALEMGYAGPEHYQALFATGIVLFVFTMLLNVITTLIVRRGFRKA